MIYEMISFLILPTLFKLGSSLTKRSVEVCLLMLRILLFERDSNKINLLVSSLI